MEGTDILLKRLVEESRTNTKPNERVGIPTNQATIPGCSLCDDRGIIFNGETATPCSCMILKKLENSFKSARLSKELAKCRFANFNLEYYRTKDNLELMGNAKKALTAAQEFTEKVIINPHETGLLFTGPVGSGKTFLAAAIANVLIEKNFRILFLIVPDLLDELRASYSSKNDKTELDLLDVARTIPILVLDDLGAHNYTEWSRNRIYSILNYRMNEQLPSIITSNLDLNEIDEYLGDRTGSRLLQMCRIFRLPVEVDIRMQKYAERERK